MERSFAVQHLDVRADDLEHAVVHQSQPPKQKFSTKHYPPPPPLSSKMILCTDSAAAKIKRISAYRTSGKKQVRGKEYNSGRVSENKRKLLLWILSETYQDVSLERTKT